LLIEEKSIVGGKVKSNMLTGSSAAGKLGADFYHQKQGSKAKSVGHQSGISGSECCEGGSGGGGERKGGDC